MLKLSLEEALNSLDKTNENHWTQNGLPRVETLRMLTGDNTLTRESISAAFPDFKIQGEETEGEETEGEETEGEETEGEETFDDFIASVSDNVENDDLATDIDYHRNILAKINEGLAKLQKVRNERLAIIDALLLEFESGLTKAEDAQDAISCYHAVQKQILQDRHKKIELIKESGIDLKLLAEGLKAPVDSKKRKK